MSDAATVIEAITSRIALPGDDAVHVEDSLTGELRSLAAWWRSLAGENPLVPREVTPPALQDWTALDAFAAGAQAADAAVDSGATLLVPRTSERDASAARVLISVLTRAEAQAVVPQSDGTADGRWMSDREWMSAVTEVRDRSARLDDLRGEPIGLLEALPAPCIAFISGALLSAAARRTTCIVDGTDELAAALVADRLSTGAKSWWIAGSQSPDAARQSATDRMGLREGLPLALTDEDGWGARSTIAMLRLIVEQHTGATLVT